jgi:hypothetical protein
MTDQIRKSRDPYGFYSCLTGSGTRGTPCLRASVVKQRFVTTFSLSVNLISNWATPLAVSFAAGFSILLVERGRFRHSFAAGFVRQTNKQAKG